MSLCNVITLLYACLLTNTIVVLENVLLLIDTYTAD